MKNYLLIFILSIFTFGCKSGSSNNEAHLKSHQELNDFVLQSVKKVEQEVSDLGTKLKSTYSNNKDTNLNAVTETELSSFYVPKTAPKTPTLERFRIASRVLDSSFEKFHKETEFTSWHYVYDSDTKSLRIYPRTNPSSFFGEDLTFDSFSFFKLAVENFHLGVWGDLKEDIKGTGKIVIFSKAILLDGHKNMTVAGIDLHILSVFKHFGDKILEQAASRPSSHTFFLCIY